MENFETQFCRLCLDSITNNNYRVIEGVTKENLEVLMTLNFDDAHKQVICSSCLQKLDAAFKFKSTCLHTSEVIVSHANLESLDPVDLNEIYLKESGTGELIDEEICRLCMQPVRKQFVSVHVVDADIFQKYIPEVNFGATVNPVICKSCADSLVVHSSFIKDCLEVEKKVKHFFAGESSDSPVVVSHLDLYIKSEKIKEEIDHEIIFKSEINLEEKDEMDNERERVKIEQTEIKMEDLDEENFQSSEDPKESPETSEFVRKREDCSNENTSFAMKTLVDESSLNVRENEKVDDLKVQTEMGKSNTSNLNLLNCDYWVYKTTASPEFKMHMEIRKNPEERSYTCDVYDYSPKTENDIKKDGLFHKDFRQIQWYKCGICNVEFKHKKSLNHHMLIHKNKIEWYKCDACDYKSKYKEYLKGHMLIHKNPSEVQQYGCDICDFKSKHKRALHRHMTVHKDALELQWYACEVCDHKFKYKCNLNKHSLKHMPVQSDVSEIKYECEVCHCKFKNKNNLNKHMVIHKDASEIQWFECNICGYKAKRKNNLNGHMLTHKDASEIQWYECDVCDYKSKHKSGLNGHMIIHKDASEIQWFKCELCDFKSKYKNHLNKHNRIHRVASGIQ